MRQARHVARMGEMGNGYEMLSGKSERKKPIIDGMMIIFIIIICVLKE
jgi:hypothetical protein